MIASKHFIGTEQVMTIYLGESLLYQNKLPLPDYLLTGKPEEAIDLAVEKLSTEE